MVNTLPENLGVIGTMAIVTYPTYGKNLRETNKCQMGYWSVSAPTLELYPECDDVPAKILHDRARCRPLDCCHPWSGVIDVGDRLA